MSLGRAGPVWFSEENSGGEQNDGNVEILDARLQRVVALALHNAAHAFVFRQGIIHAFPDTSLASAKFARIQAAPYRALEGHLN